MTTYLADQIKLPPDPKFGGGRKRPTRARYEAVKGAELRPFDMFVVGEDVAKQMVAAFEASTRWYVQAAHLYLKGPDTMLLEPASMTATYYRIIFED